MKITLFTPSKFKLGETVITTNADSQLRQEAIVAGIMRHAAGDWGEVCPADAAMNDEGLREGERLLSVYRDGETVFWIITERDRSVTTVLMPEDY